jgi:hypothetical protein
MLNPGPILRNVHRTGCTDFARNCTFFHVLFCVFVQFCVETVLQEVPDLQGFLNFHSFRPNLYQWSALPLSYGSMPGT